MVKDINPGPSSGKELSASTLRAADTAPRAEYASTPGAQVGGLAGWRGDKHVAHTCRAEPVLRRHLLAVGAREVDAGAVWVARTGFRADGSLISGSAPVRAADVVAGLSADRIPTHAARTISRKTRIAECTARERRGAAIGRAAAANADKYE